jgi:hypothetical protein
MRSNSRVFDEYCKIMAEKEGKVTKTAERRRDPEGISKLYGVTEDSKIIEQAHPETKVIARSEKNEGIAENQIEQNTKSTNIALKSPHGNIPGTPVNKLAARKDRRKEIVALFGPKPMTEEGKGVLENVKHYVDTAVEQIRNKKEGRPFTQELIDRSIKGLASMKAMPGTYPNLDMNEIGRIIDSLQKDMMPVDIEKVVKAELKEVKAYGAPARDRGKPRLYDVSQPPAGKALLEQAHPKGDVEVAKSQSGLGKVFTEKSQQEYDLSIVYKVPTGKLANIAINLSKVAEELDNKGLEEEAIELDDVVDIMAGVIQKKTITGTEEYHRAKEAADSEVKAAIKERVTGADEAAQVERDYLTKLWESEAQEKLQAIANLPEKYKPCAQPVLKKILEIHPNEEIKEAVEKKIIK